MSTTTQTTSKLDEVKFLRSLYKRLGLTDMGEEETKKQLVNNAGKAIFKRAMSGESRYITKAREFLPYMGEKSVWQETHIWIPVACLSVYYPQPIVKSERPNNFGYSCFLLQQEIQRGNPEAKGVSRRFKALLDISLGDMQTPLNALVRQIKQMKIQRKEGEFVIDYPKLLSDLQQWDHADQYIQDQWARSFWGAVSKTDEAP